MFNSKFKIYFLFSYKLFCLGDLLHKFPNPKVRLPLMKQWIQIIGREQFSGLYPFAVYTKKRICSDHFRPSDYVRGTDWLKRHAFPTLNVQTKVIGNKIDIFHNTNKVYFFKAIMLLLVGHENNENDIAKSNSEPSRDVQSISVMALTNDTTQMNNPDLFYEHAANIQQ